MELENTIAIDLWKNMLLTVQEKGERFTDRRNRTCIECLSVTARLLTTKKGVSVPIQILSSFDKWLYPDLQDVANVILSTKGDYGYSYAKRLFSTKNAVNQIDDYVVTQLLANPSSRQAVAILFDPQVDKDSHEKPSILCFDFKLRNGKLHVSCFIRSCDIFIGFPANLYQSHVLQEYVAQKVNAQTGELTFFLASAHIFDEYTQDIANIIKDHH